MTAVSSQPVRSSRFPTLEKYDVLEELGHGGMATVYRAHDRRLGRDVAVKVIHPHLRDSAEAVRRFSIEARAVAKLRHANIVEVYDVSSATESEQYLVVELLRGVTLRKLLELHGAVPVEVAASIGVELLGALAHAHDEGVIHRDVKPENVIIENRPASTKSATKNDVASETSLSGSMAPVPSVSPTSDSSGDRVSIKLTDFGIAKLLDAQGVTSTGQVLGSPAHMAPEQIEGREVDQRADVFGLGVLLYECMVGHLPFQGNNPAQVLRRVLEGEYPSAENELPKVGRVWSRILDQALAPSIEARFTGAPQMRDALTRELTRLGVTSPRSEIGAWLDDPAGFARSHETAMTARLCAKADEASRKGDVLSAAADYNRALAYAPHDATLLKIVAGMNRRSARLHVVRRVSPYVIVALLVAGVGVGLRSTLARRARVDPAKGSSSVTVPFVAAPSSSAVLVPTTATPLLVPSARTVAHPAVGPRPPTPPKPTSREVHFVSVAPPQGVLVSIDGAEANDLDPTKPLVLDDKAHSLVFSCTRDLCDQRTETIAAGDRAVDLHVRLAIKPAKLIVKGVPGRNYALHDDPARPLFTGDLSPNEIQMKGASRRVVKVDEVNTGRSLSVELRAGDAVAKSVDFTNMP
jgi:serine/threonine protein kinase